MKLNKLLIAILAVVTIAATSCQKYSDQKPTIAGIAVAGADFSMLEAAAIKGGVAIVLSNPNPADPSGHYTVFAPNNAAFARLGLVDEGSLAALNTTFLTNTLLYHVSNGDLLGNALTTGSTSKSALGPTRRIIMRGTDKYINGSKILATDISASNGTVHVIDKVMIASGDNIVNTAIAATTSKIFAGPELTFLVAAVVKSGLAAALSDPSANFTIYAPSDAAFMAAGFKTPADVSALPASTLQAVLLNHAVAGGKFTSEVSSTTATTAGGGTLTYGAFDNGMFTIKSKGITTPANMVIPDIQCTNGIVHIIDKVLLP